MLLIMLYNNTLISQKLKIAKGYQPQVHSFTLLKLYTLGTSLLAHLAKAEVPLPSEEYYFVNYSLISTAPQKLFTDSETRDSQLSNAL